MHTYVKGPAFKMNAVKLKMVRNIIVFEKEPRRFGEHILGKKAIVGSSTKNNR